jgi:hypothetical protein
MSKNQDKGRRLQFVMVYTHIMDSPAWLAMSYGARLLFIALKRNYSSNFGNNGRLFLSTRKAAKMLGCSRNSVTTYYGELQHYGFIVQTRGAHLGVEGKGKAAHWRSTDEPCAKDQPTRDYLRWDGVPFERRKKQNPVPTVGTPRPRRCDTSVQKFETVASRVSQVLGHKGLCHCPNGWDISKSTRSPSQNREGP